MDHEQIRNFFKTHMKNLHNRQKFKKERLTKENNTEMKSKLKKVALDQHNFFMRNSTKGNYSILAQSSHPSKKKQIFDLANKKKEYEKQLKAKINKQIEKFRSKEINYNNIPHKEDVSILFEHSPYRIQKDVKTYAFGSSMVMSQFGNKEENQEERNKREYKKFQRRKEIGKQYLDELKKTRIIIQKEILLGPKNTKILEEKNETQRDGRTDSARTMVNTEFVQPENIDFSKFEKNNKDNKNKTFVILEKSTKRKKKKRINSKENKTDKKHVNYLKTIKVGKSKIKNYLYIF